MASFTVFRNLPSELQDAIWQLSLPDPQSEVCIVWPLVMHEWLGEQPVQPFMVDTPWPSVTHVCRSAREAIKRSGALRLRHSSVAGFAVPCRAFDPAIDTLYWGQTQASTMEFFFQQPQNAALARSLRHVAIELPVIYPPSVFAEFIRGQAIFLRTLSLVLPDQSETHSTRTAFLPPARRFRLQDVPKDILQRITLVEVPFLEAHMNKTQSLTEFLKSRREDMDDNNRRFNVQGDEGTAWNTHDDCFSGLEMKVQSFVEYAGREWREVCSHRTLGRDLQPPQPRHIPQENRRNPGDYRVLDDDCGAFGHSDAENTPLFPVPSGYEMELGPGS